MVQHSGSNHAYRRRTVSNLIGDCFSHPPYVFVLDSPWNLMGANKVMLCMMC